MGAIFKAVRRGEAWGKPLINQLDLLNNDRQNDAIR